MSSPDIFSSHQPSGTPRKRRKRKPGQSAIEPQSPGSSSQASASGFTSLSQSHILSTAQHPQDSGGFSAASGSVRSKRRRRKKRKERPELPNSPGYQESSDSDADESAPTAPGESPYRITDDTRILSPLELLRQTFYERLVLLYALDPAQERRAEHVKTPEADQLDSFELRHAFLSAIAYVCDTQKGGRTCTAATLQEGTQSKVLVLASNSTTINETTQDQVRLIMWELSKFDGEQRNEQLLEDRLIRIMVDLSGERRMQQYVRFLKINIDKFEKNESFVGSLGIEFRAILGYLQRMFKALYPHPDLENRSPAAHRPPTISRDSLYRAVTQCHSLSKSREMARVRTQQQYSNRLTGPFWDLRHSIGRLAKFRTVAKTLIRTAKVYPQLFPDIEVQVLENTTESWGNWPPISNGNLDYDLHSTLKRILMNIVDENEPAAQAYLEKLDRFNEELERLQVPDMSHTKTSVKEVFNNYYSKLSARGGKIRVHAETLILEHSERTKEFRFADDDRFIGCSKLSCYLCDQYFTTVPRTNTLATHNKIYPLWRLPDRVPEAEQMNFLSGMVSRLGTEIKKTLDERTERRTQHTDSTTGVTCPTYRSDLESLSMDSFGSDVGEASEEEDGGSDTYYEASGQPKGQDPSKAASGLDPISGGVGDMRLDMPGSFPG